MLGELETSALSLVISVFSFIIFSISVLIVYMTFRNNERFHRQKMLNEIVSEERRLKIKLNEYQEKIRKASSPKEVTNFWNEHDTLLFNFYEYVSLLILNDSLPLIVTRDYFRRIFVDVYASFSSKETFFGQDDIERKDYSNLIKLFMLWDIKELYNKIYRE
ncbi:MAG: hypothetical protein PF542_01365 [Nanoarchaeota archaeon]|jgi:hypothetical protein|nr:hypothetical protein [Nanoarchaeota archaeon]